MTRACRARTRRVTRVHSARYADRKRQIRTDRKLLAADAGQDGAQRAAYFVCAIALAKGGRALQSSQIASMEKFWSAAGAGGLATILFYSLPWETFAELPAKKKISAAIEERFRQLLAALSSAIVLALMARDREKTIAEEEIRCEKSRTANRKDAKAGRAAGTDLSA